MPIERIALADGRDAGDGHQRDDRVYPCLPAKSGIALARVYAE